MSSRGVTINGQEFNIDQVYDIDGVEWEITKVTGLGEPAPVYDSDQNVARDGKWAGKAVSGSRAIGLEGVLRAPSELMVEEAFDKVRALVPADEFPLTLHYESGDRTFWVRRDGELDPDSREIPTEISWSVVCVACDPSIYAGDAAGSGHIALATGLPVASGGVAFPLSFPMSFPGVSATGDVTTVLKRGGKVFFKIVGPGLNPRIIVTNSLGVFELAWDGMLAAGMWIDVDPQKPSAMVQGQASRVPWLRNWPVLCAGLNTFSFRASEYSSAHLEIVIHPTL